MLRAAGAFVARHGAALICVASIAASVVTARAAAPTPQLVFPSPIDVNQVALGLQANQNGTGYFTLLEGASPTAGSALQTKAGLDGKNAPAARIGSLPLTAETMGHYTVTNLKANTAYTVCFTADNGTELATSAITAEFTTKPLPAIPAGSWNPVRWSDRLPSSTSVSLAMTTQGQPAVAYAQSTGAAAVTVFPSGNWEDHLSISAGAVEQIKVAVAPDNTWYVGYADVTAGNKVVVKKSIRIDGNLTWQAVGSAVSTGAVESFSLAIAPDGTPYTAFLEGGAIKVMRFSGVDWIAAEGGSAWAGTADQLSLAISHQGEPFIAFRDSTQANATYHWPVVRKLSGGDWENVGGDFVYNSECSSLQLAFAPDGTLHVMSCKDGKPYLIKEDATFVWTNVGMFDQSGSGAALAFAPDGVPYVAFADAGISNRAVVRHYKNGEWGQLYGDPLSKGAASALSLAVGQNGTPYLAFIDGVASDGLGGGKVKLLAFEPNSAPTISGTLANQAVNDNTTIKPFSGVTIADENTTQTVTVGVQIAPWWNGTLTNLNGFSPAGSGYYKFDGTASMATILIQALVFQPLTNDLPVGQMQTTTFTVSVADNVAEGVEKNTTVVSTSVNDAPTFLSASVSLSTTDEDTASSPIDVSEIATNTQDLDRDSSVGIAVTAKEGNGTWQYSTDGNTWTGFPAVSADAALLLSRTSKVRYVPDSINGEIAKLTFHAWDQTTGTASANGTPSQADATKNGGTTAFSAAPAVASLPVAPINDAPTATDDAFTVAEDSAATVLNVRANDTDVDVGAVLTVTAVTQPATGGTVDLAGGTVSFTPTGNFFGSSVFTYTVSDGQGGSATATVTVTVTSVNDLPTAVNDTFSVAADSAASVLAVLANDTYLPDAAETLTITAVTQPADGTVSFTATNVSFTPAAAFVGSTSFTYTISDGLGGYTTGTVTVTVRAENRAPTAIALNPGSVVRSAAANTAVGTLSTTDPDTGDTFTYTLVNGTGDTDNSSFNLLGATLRANNPLTLPVRPCSVRVRSTDAGGLSYEQALAITVVNDVLTVTSNADDGAGSLRQAIANLAPGGVISFALQSPNETISIASQLLINKSLTIDGRNTAGSGIRVTVQVTQPGVSTWRTMAIHAGGKAGVVKLQNLALRGGDVHAYPLQEDCVGGVALLVSGVLELADVTLTDGAAKAGGGLAVFSAAQATRCTFSGNRAIGVSSEAGGGGVANLEGSLVLINSTVAGNTSQSNAGFSQGGGVYSYGFASIINSTLTGNTASGTAAEGGGVYNQSGSLRVLNTIIAGNQSTSGADLVTHPSASTISYYSWLDKVSGPFPAETADAPNQRDTPYAGQLGTLGLYGGATQTVRVNASEPAVNRGTTVYDDGFYWFRAKDGYHRLDDYTITTTVEPAGKISTDQRGVARTSSPTIGAYQVGPSVTGTITRAGGGALSGVAVSGGGRSATTDVTGSFAVRNLAPGTHTITPSYPGYTFTPAARSVVVADADVSGIDFTATPVPVPPPSKDAQTITFPPLADVTLGQTVNLTASASSGLSVTFTIKSGPATLSGRTLTTTGAGLVTVRATQAGNSSYDAAPAVERSFMVVGGLPPAPVVPPAIGGSATLTVPGSNAGLSYQWQRNGQTLTGATGVTLTLSNVQPSAAGLYTYTAQTAGGGTGASEPVIVGPSTTEKVVGTGSQAGADIRHPNGNIYDQLLLEGSGASFTADPGQVTRMSFVDLSDDIVQVEFSGAGTLSLVMDNAPAGAPAANYNQPGVNYVRGNVGIVITGANETTNVSVFSVGRITAVNQTLFRDGVAYDGVANIGFIAIQSTNGRFGGVRTGNVEYFAASGYTGLYAPGVTFAGPVNIGDIQAYDKAQPMLVVGSASTVQITGGSLAQPNGQPIHANGLTHLTMAPGQTSQGNPLPAQANQGVLQQQGVDVTDLIVGR